MKRSQTFDFVGAFEQGWIQYKANWKKLVPLGILAMIPPAFFFYSIWAGVLGMILVEGFLLLVLTNAVYLSSNFGEISAQGLWPKLISRFFINGCVLASLIFPLLLLGLVAAIVPSVIFFSFFIFSFCHVVKGKFALDAFMESYRSGKNYRLPLFLLALFFYSSMVIIYLATESIPLFFVIAGGIFLPYFFIIIQEFFDQLEKK